MRISDWSSDVCSSDLELADVAVVAIAPILPIVKMGQLFGIKPHRAGGGFAHFGARGGGQQRSREAIEVGAVHPAAQLHTVDDIAPLVGPAHLQTAAHVFGQLAETIALQTNL